MDRKRASREVVFVARHTWSLPLTSIVEGVLHATMTYFRDKRQAAFEHIQNIPNTPYCRKIKQYMDAKIEKARLHTVIPVGNAEWRFEVRLPATRFGAGNELKTHEVMIGNEAEPTCQCSCNKPRLLHLPCSHVLAVCSQLKIDPLTFVSFYYSKEAVLSTWTGEMTGFRVVGNFNKVNTAEREYVPNQTLMRVSRGRRKCRRIRNDMDESEAGGCTRLCLLYNEYGHREKKCPQYVESARGRGNRGGPRGGRRGRRGGQRS